jgi:exodeoxyribonuclease-5
MTNDQTLAFNYLLLSITKEKTESELSLRGFAGTGKTWLVGRLVKELLKNPDIVVGCAAPTNKAVHAMKRLSPVAKNNRVWFGTLHSFMGLKPRLNEDTGEEIFEPDTRKHPIAVDVLIVDESSMVGRDLYAHTRDRGICQTDVIVWVGDPAQLPPVKEVSSPTINLSGGVTLREIVRHGSAIQECVNKIRDSVEQNTDPFITGDTQVADEGVFLVNRDQMINSMLTDFRSARFKEDSNFVRALAWTNKAVDWGNDLVHRHLYGDNAEPFVPEQVLIANSPVFDPNDDKDILMATSDECKVITATRYTGNDDSGYADFWRLTVDLLTDSLEPDIGTLFVIDPKHHVVYDQRVNAMRQNALRPPKEGRSGRWRMYYQFINRYADLKPCYWSTVHKAQGSTFERVYIATPDIYNNRNAQERRRMIYTAFTRAAKQLYIVQ